MDAFLLIPAPWVLAAGALAAATIALHALARRRLPTVAFPAARLLGRGSAARRAAMRTPADAMLALTRALAVALAALAAGAPLALEPQRRGEDGGPAPVVVVLDCSLSMSRPLESAAGGSAFDEARELAVGAVLGAQRAGQPAAVVLAGARPEAPIPRLSTRYGALVRSLETARAQEGRADGGAALELAAQIAAPSARAQVIALSDFQPFQWPEAVGARERRVRVSGGAPPVVIEHAELRPARPVAGEPVELVATLRSSDGSAQRALLRARTQGHGAAGVADVPAGGVMTARLALGALAPGAVEAAVEIVGAASSYDTGVRVAAWVREAREVAVLTGADTDDAEAGAAYALRALAGEGAPARVRVRIEREPRARGPLVVINAGALGEDAVGAIAARLEDGQGTLWVVDSAASRASLGALLARLGIEENGGVRAPSEDSIAWIDDTSGALGPLADPAQPAHGALMDSAMGEVWALPELPAARVHARGASGAPVLATLARAPLTILSASLDPGDSGIAESPVFPVLMHALAAHLDGGESPSLIAGEGGEAVIEAEASDPPFDVDGVRAPFEERRGGVVVRVPPAEGVGVRRITDARGRVVGIVADGAARSEAEPTPARAPLARGTGEGSEEGERDAPPAHLLLLGAALGLLVVEPFLRRRAREAA